jgi:hypothetical protein
LRGTAGGIRRSRDTRPAETIIVIVDDVGKENMEARSGRPVTSQQIAAAQEDSENDGADELLPDGTESISTWFARIAKSIDFGGDKIALWDGLRA